MTNILENLFKLLKVAKKNIKYYICPIVKQVCKLFSNTYLATRVSFFNELDSFCVEKKLDSKSIIDGLSWIQE